MSVKLLTDHHLESLSLKGGCTGSHESTFVKKNTLLEITCHGSFIPFTLSRSSKQSFNQLCSGKTVMWCSQAICLLLLLGILAPTFGLPSRKLQIKVTIFLSLFPFLSLIGFNLFQFNMIQVHFSIVKWKQTLLFVPYCLAIISGFSNKKQNRKMCLRRPLKNR